MQKLRTRSFTPRPPVIPSSAAPTPAPEIDAAPEVDAAPGASPAPHTRLMLVDFHSGDVLERHPDLAPLLQQGWAIRSAVPRLVEAKGPQLLVVLHRDDAAPLRRVQ